MKGFTRHLDGDNSLIIDVFHESAEAIKALEELKLTIFDSYINGLSEDEWGNIHLSTKTPTGEVHDLQLNYTHHPGRRSGESKVDKIKRVAVELKDAILDNLKSNIQLQNQADTIVEFTSCFHMKRILSCEERIDLLKKLYQIYGVDYTHQVEKVGFAVPGWDITVSYDAKNHCTEEDLINQFKTLWPKLNKEWITWNKEKAKRFQTKEFWKLMIENYGFMCCDLFQLLTLVMAISPGTGLLERSYSKLEKICKKDRNHLDSKSIESLWLLAIFNLVDDEALFDGVCKEMAKQKST